MKKLVDWADFGFITEPGQDIRNGLNGFTLPGLQRNEIQFHARRSDCHTRM
jgi:hypothetical protein